MTSSENGNGFQHFNLFPHMTILDNMTLAPMKVKGVSKERGREKSNSSFWNVLDLQTVQGHIRSSSPVDRNSVLQS